MWKKANIFSLLLITFLLTLELILISQSYMKPKPGNEELMTTNLEKTSELLLQEAAFTTKDLWMNKEGGKRFHYHLEAPSSRIVLKRSPEKNELIEEMQNMRLWMQDRFHSHPRSSQQVRFVQSPIAFFDFTKLSLSSNDAFIALYSTPGEELSYYLKPESISMRGKADHFDVQVQRGGINFSAKGFTAQISENGDFDVR